MVTVVITTCKRTPDLVERAILSVIHQLYTEWELMVIDDSPSDWELRNKVSDMVLSYSAKNNIQYIPNETNKGACFSRNVGLMRAKGKYIGYLDDDDEWLPEKLTKQVKALDESSEDVALVYGPFYRKIIETGEIELLERPLLSGMLYDELMHRGNIFGGMSMPLMRTQCVIDVGGFDELMQSVQDMDLWLRLAKQYKIISIPYPLVVYYEYKGERISNNPLKKIAGLQRLYSKNMDYLLANKELYRKTKSSLIPFYLLAGNYKGAISIWKEMTTIDPFRVWPNIKEIIHIFIYMIRKGIKPKAN